MEKIYSKSSSLKENGNSFCPGCLHGVATKLVAETLDKLNLREKTIGVLPVGCGTLNINYFNIDMIIAAHGRAPAVATGIKRTSPDKIVFTYQGDGDLASIGLTEIMHCANRGENITVIFVNNCIYGMTGGQMAPTTLEGQIATTATKGRDVMTMGYPMKMTELISQLESPVYVARFSLDSAKGIMQAKKGIEKAFTYQMEGRGFSFIELLSNCPTNWKVSALDSITWMRENSLPYYKIGEYKTLEGRSQNGK